jgi:hypothetical protein
VERAARTLADRYRPCRIASSSLRELIVVGSTRGHCIDDAALAEAPPWRQVLPDALHTIDRHWLLAFNVLFDQARIATTTMPPASTLLPVDDPWGIRVRQAGQDHGVRATQRGEPHHQPLPHP